MNPYTEQILESIKQNVCSPYSHVVDVAAVFVVLIIVWHFTMGMSYERSARRNRGKP